MINEIQNSDFVLIACTENYYRRFRGHEEHGKGLGARWEGFVITQDLFDNASDNRKFIPILFSDEDARFIPEILRSATHYRVDRADGYEDLYRRVTAQPRVKKPPLGLRRVFDTAMATPVRSAETSPGPDVEIRPEQSDVPDLVLVYRDENGFAFLPSSRVELGEELLLELLPADARKSAFLADLGSSTFHHDIAVAYRNKAIRGRITRAVSSHQDGRGFGGRISRLARPTTRYFTISTSTAIRPRTSPNFGHDVFF
jgi:hypothetical protein